MTKRISELSPATVAALANEFEINEVGTSKKLTGTLLNDLLRKDTPFPIVEIVPEGSVGSADVHAFVTAAMKQDGWVLPDSVSASTINFRGYLPPTLNATPNMRIIVMIITLSAIAASDVHLRIRGKYRNTGEDLDVARNDVDISADITMAATIETVTYHTFNPATDPAPNDIFTFNVERDPANAGDTHTGDVLIFVKGVVDL